ncbi:MULTISPECIES: hypothetical protein [Acinetobacter]|uniref:Uncharacterized protein n=1 Tax=Acinetobacter piscicola TaxID=2006115 RepID=A0A7S6VX32_9GAMM|nr:MULTISPECIES: hypothetical protein [Acinetobacter]QOW46449.1 hypothetical protein G0028_11385 [Acinetobacter piscicola]
MNIPFTIESNNTLDIEDLLPKIPPEIILKSLKNTELSESEESLIKKINVAAENAITPLPLGISAIGELLAHSAEQVEPNTICNIGWLIESLGRQMSALGTLVEVSESALSENKNIKGKGGLMS